LKRYHDCISSRYITYQATSAEPLSPVFNGGMPSYGAAETVRVSNIVAGQHVEIVLQHIATLVVLRKHGRHFSVAVRTPGKIATAFAGGPDVQLCTTRCPVAERLSLNHITSSLSTEDAVTVCREEGLVDFFLDACVFDLLATGGDRDFSLAAVFALRDYRRLSRDAARHLRNRTTIHVTSCAHVTKVFLDYYLVILLSLLLSSLTGLMHLHGSSYVSFPPNPMYAMQRMQQM